MEECNCKLLRDKSGNPNALCLPHAKQNAYKQAVKKNTLHGLPELKGTSKQVKWAEVIRAKMWKAWDGDFAHLANKRPDHELLLGNVRRRLFAEKNASWWIENRKAASQDVFAHFVRTTQVR